MESEKLYAMSFGKLYGLLIAKAQRRGRTREEVDEVTAWLNGWTAAQIEEAMHSGMTYGEFFSHAPKLNPARGLITGRVCGVRVEEQVGLMREIRYLDKLVDELAKGRPMEKILRAGAPK